MERIETDVLVIGAGGAGLRAAIAAREEGCSVLVACKTTPALGTATAISNGVFGSSGYGMSAEEYARLTAETGYNLNNPALVNIFAREIPERIEEVRARGARFTEAPTGVVAVRRPPDSGREVADVLLAWARESGVVLSGSTTAARLILHDGVVTGCIAVKRDGRRLSIKTKAVILCTGGASALYRIHDNPTAHVGDGYALGAAAGAAVEGMEFIQFYPLIADEPNAPRLLIQPFLAESGKLVNDLGENLIEKYDLTALQPVALRARDLLCRVMFRESREGRRLYLDLRGIRDRDWENPFAHNDRSTLVRRLRADVKPIAITPAAHFTMGGMVIDEDCRTTVPGLFAAGESSYGLHGANRLGGNGLSETLVFGRRAGLAAGQYCREQGSLPRAGSEEKDLFPDSAPYLSGTLTPREMLGRIRELLWTYCGPVRNKEGLATAAAGLDRLVEQGLLCRTASETASNVAVWNGLQTAKLIVKGAIERRESIGAHFRED